MDSEIIIRYELKINDTKWTSKGGPGLDVSW